MILLIPLALLKNEGNILPLKKSGSIALIGPMADAKENMTGTWSVAAVGDNSTSLRKGLETVAGKDVVVRYAKGSNLIGDAAIEERATMFDKSIGRDNRTDDEMMAEALEIAKSSDVIIAAMGETAEFSGESASRTNLDIPDVQKTLLMELMKLGKPVVLVLFAGRPLTLNWEQANVPAILDVWFGGSEAGYSIPDVLFGDVNPSGKLTTTFPQNVGQIPIYYNHKNTGRPLPEGKWFQKFRSNYLDVSNDPLYPFGYGLSYTIFEYGKLKVSSDKLKGAQTLTASIEVKNTGKVDGKEIVQLYIRDMVGTVTRPVKELKGFQKVMIKAGETKTIEFKITPEDLKFYNSELKFDWESGDFQIMIGKNSQELSGTLVNWQK